MPQQIEPSTSSMRLRRSSTEQRSWSSNFHHTAQSSRLVETTEPESNITINMRPAVGRNRHYRSTDLVRLFGTGH
jgi:hypothetical protein